MPYGLCNAPATFQKTMNLVFGDMVGNCLTVYIDDIQIFSSTFEEHIRHLREVMNRLRSNGLFLKPKKCVLGTDESKYLGFIVGRKGLSTDPAKVKDVQMYPRPANQTEMRAFLGLATYYRRFIKNFSQLASPLNLHLKGSLFFRRTPYT